MGPNEMIQIVNLIDRIVTNIDDEETSKKVNAKVKELCESFPLYNELHE